MGKIPTSFLLKWFKSHLKLENRPLWTYGYVCRYGGLGYGHMDAWAMGVWMYGCMDV